MKKDYLDSFFETAKKDFDIEEPSANHKQRFLEKLNDKGELYLTSENRQRRRLWKPLLGVAASILLIITLGLSLTSQDNELRDLASVSPEMAKTENFFTVTISEELYKLENASSPETQKLIQDAIKRLANLEKAYENLKKDLNESGDDKRVIFAMITNFQTRIEILKHTLQEIDNIKQSKITSYETNSTI
ncbi:hypothetical protein [Hyunsoonleella ulvae]|uniref:hypothetical protein n=1 Tax=Hyunsoonleella ulvae TaxID=2799948 RepID=UPI00193A5D03|nr:hypothetical protein [Hyunsoonleella ulvae]